MQSKIWLDNEHTGSFMYFLFLSFAFFIETTPIPCRELNHSVTSILVSCSNYYSKNYPMFRGNIGANASYCSCYIRGYDVFHNIADFFQLGFIFKWLY